MFDSWGTSKHVKQVLNVYSMNNIYFLRQSFVFKPNIFDLNMRECANSFVNGICSYGPIEIKINTYIYI